MNSGLMGEFETPEAIVDAVKRLRARGLTQLDTFTPYPLPELDEALGVTRTRAIPAAVLAAALTGAAAAYLIQWWTSAVDYPLDVGGRPLHSAPAFVPVTFETAVLLGALAAFVALLIAARLPRLWSPVFEVEGFESASIDRFWVGVDLGDPGFSRRAIEAAMRDAGALRVVPVGGLA
jgi:hypothetical protein